MIKKIITAGILFVILATSIAPVGVRAIGSCSGDLIPQGENCVKPSEIGKPPTSITEMLSAASYNFIAEGFASFIGFSLQRISGLFLLVSGLLFDKVVDETVVKMSQNIGADSGIGLSINQAWGTLRDIANMVFIFVLLYTAFNAMFSMSVGNVGRNIVWIIVIALVINFSLFFSKVVIDASNVVSLGFYKAIANAGSYNINLERNSDTQAETTPASFGFKGISGGYMRMLGIHSFWSSDTNTENIYGAQNVLIVGIMTAIFVLIAAVILFITSIMFVSRFVILIFIMILSPVAFVMYIIPSMSGKFKEWVGALINQSFFAPVFFALTWVVFKVGGSANFLNNSTVNGVNWTQIVSAPSAMMGLLINYFIIIGLTIFALTASKKMASSAAGFTALSTALGGAAAGTAAWASRNTIGRKALSIANDKDLRDRAAAGNIGARMKLWTAGQAAGSSFDVRSVSGTAMGKTLGLDKSMDILGKAGGKDGFAKSVENKAKAKADYAKKYYGQTAQETELSRTAEAEYNKLKLNDETRIKEQRGLDINKNEEEIEKIEKDIEENEKNAKASSNSLEKQKEYGDKIKESKNKLNELKKINFDLKKKNKDNKFDDSEYDEKTINKKEEWQSNKDAGKNRMKEFAERIKRGPLGIGFIGKMQGNQEAARKIIEAAEGKDKKKPKDLMKELGKLVGVEDEEENKTKEASSTEENKTNTENNKNS